MSAFLRIWVKRVKRACFVQRCSVLAAAGLLLAASSCQTSRPTVSNNPTPPAPQVTSRVTESRPRDPHIHHAVVSDSGTTAMIEPLGYETDRVAPETSVVRVDGELPAQPAAATSVTPIVHAAETRVALDDAHAANGDSRQATFYPDEYICDGGDRGHPVHFNGPVRQGLDAEDTVGEFVDENGERHVLPSTQACVYAPRFASVRSISQPVLDFSIDKPAGAHDGIALAGLARELAPDTQAQSDQLSGINMRSRASGLGVDAGDSSVRQLQTTEQHLKIQNVYEDRNFFSEGQFQQGMEPVLAYGIQLAGVWTRDLNPIIVAADDAGQQVSGQFKAEEHVGVEDRRTPGELEILKTADKASAHPGDEITFTIRFTNGGGRPLYQVRIIDHLTPRIEYVPASALSELDGRLDITDEDDGTQLLTFELAEPLEGGQTGEITFRVLVR